jgi:hypothetical protein
MLRQKISASDNLRRLGTRLPESAISATLSYAESMILPTSRNFPNISKRSKREHDKNKKDMTPFLGGKHAFFPRLTPP